MAFNSFLDARHEKAGAVIETDLCIIGSGAAGITIAREFVGSSIRVCLLEAGGLSINPEVADPSVIDSVGREYVNKYRRVCACLAALQIIGVATACRSSPSILKSFIGSIIVAGHMRMTNWSRIARAHAALGLGAFDYDARRIIQALGLEQFPFDPLAIETVISRYNAVRFGLAFGDELATAPNMRVFLYAEVTRLNLQDGGNALSTALIVTVAGNELTENAKYFDKPPAALKIRAFSLLSNH